MSLSGYVTCYCRRITLMQRCSEKQISLGMSSFHMIFEDQNKVRVSRFKRQEDKQRPLPNLN